MCGNSMKFDLVYEYHNTTLADHYYHKKNNQDRFNSEEVRFVVFNVCQGLKDVKIMQDCHGNVTMRSIIVDRDVLLSDPIVEEIEHQELSSYRKTKIHGYPSPAALFNRIDTGMNLDNLKEDLFSVGMIALQLVNL